MPTKIVDLPGIGPVTLQKHSRSRSLKITLKPDGGVLVTMPAWTPFTVGSKFAQSKQDWIAEHRVPVTLLKNGMAIGKYHHLYFTTGTGTRTTTRTSGTELRVTYPSNLSFQSPAVQSAARKAITRVLKTQAEQLLPQRLTTLAEKHDFTFSSVSVRQLKSRWGSCDQKQAIVLNLFLMQLPWDLIDYVLLHELVHTEHLHHGPDFWARFEEVLPGAKQKRKLLKAYKPSI